MIIEYEEKYLDDVRDLLVELEEFIISIDKDNLDVIHPDYKEKMAIVDLEELEKNNGKCYLYVEDNKVLALIMGCVRPYDNYDYLDYKCPKTGIIISFTNDVTIDVKAPPTIIPTAKSITLPLEINSLNSLIIFFILYSSLSINLYHIF